MRYPFSNTATVLLLAGLCHANTSPGESSPEPIHTDDRIKTFVYQENQVYSIKAHYYVSTYIKFSSDEILRTDLPLSGGDLEAWDIQYVGPRAMSIKPTDMSPKTNLTVISDKREYFFDLDLSKEKKADTTTTYAILFKYPEIERQKLLEAERAETEDVSWQFTEHLIDPAAVNADYTFRGKKKMRPRQVFDDGKFTYFLFKDTDPVPAIFAKDGRELTLVNITHKGDFIVVQRLADEFQLLSGKTKLRVLRNHD